MSIRLRLAAAYCIGVAATLLIVGLLVWWQMSDTLVHTLEGTLQTRASGVLASLENRSQAGLQDSDLASPGIWTVLRNAQGQVIDASAGAPADVPVLAGAVVVDGHSYLVRVDRAQDGTIVVTGTDFALVSTAQAALMRILFGVGLSVGAASLIVGWILAGKALSPIDRLIAEAEGLGPADLGQRLGPPRRIDEVGRLTLTLNGMLDRINEAVARQRLFVALASHELRTPLAALRAELDLADREGADLSEYRDAIRAARGDAVRLASLTASLLALATIGDEAHPLVRSPVPARDLATSAIRAVAPLIEQSGARLTTEVTAQVVWVDRGAVEQALINLLGNAIVHSRGQEQIELHGELSAWPTGQLLRLSVLDRGPGFGANDVDDMFTPFRRGDGVRAAGSGLGLAMVAATARAHGGTFGAANRSGGGAVVWLAVPCAQPPESRLLEAARRSERARVAQAADLRDDVAADQLDLGEIPDVADAEDRVLRPGVGPVAEALDQAARG